MEAMDIPYLAAFAPVAIAVGLIIEGLKTKVPGVGDFFKTKFGTVVLLFLPMLLGIAGGLVLKAAGAVQEPYVGGVCAGGLSSLVYDLVHKTFKSKQGVDEAPPPPPATP